MPFNPVLVTVYQAYHNGNGVQGIGYSLFPHGLINVNGGVNLLGPGQNTAFKIYKVGKTLLLQLHNGCCAALAAAAHYHNRLVFIYFFRFNQYAAKRYQGAADVRHFVFKIFPNVYQLKIFALVFFLF